MASFFTKLREAAINQNLVRRCEREGMVWDIEKDFEVFHRWGFITGPEHVALVKHLNYIPPEFDMGDIVRVKATGKRIILNAVSDIEDDGERRYISGTDSFRGSELELISKMVCSR